MKLWNINLLRRNKDRYDGVDYYEICNSRLGPVDMNYHFSMSFRKNYFYCEVSKAGCSQIKSNLWRAELANTPLPKNFWQNNWDVHCNFTSHILIKPFQIGKHIFNSFIASEETTKWIVVRNPYTRMLSAYLDKVRRNTGHFHSLRDHVAKQRGTVAEDVNGESVSFLEFCKAVEAVRNPSNLDQHWRPQYWHTCADIIPYNLIGKLEEITSFEEKLRDTIGIDDLGFRGGRGHKTDASIQLRKHYCSYSKDIVDRVYADDFANFGYEKEIPA